MGSTRLPGKQLKDVLGRPLISYVFERLQRVKGVDDIILATTDEVRDDVLATFCQSKGIRCYRGSENDVLERFAQAAAAFDADVIVRICADCPFIDPAIVEEVIKGYFDSKADYASNVLERTYPRGMDVEVFSRRLLVEAAQEAKLPEEREHVTPFFYRQPDRFRLHSIVFPSDESSYRWTVDTEDDLTLIRKYMEDLYPHNPAFTLHDLLQCGRKHPEWAAINAHVKQKTVEGDASNSFALELVRPIEAHARLILQWRNDPDTRKASFHSEVKPWESFYKRFTEEYFNIPALPPLFVVENGNPVAFLRLEPYDSPSSHQKKCCRISINVAPDARGRGIGVQSLLLAKEFLFMQGYDEAYAEVKSSNEASTKAFTNAGFTRLPDVTTAVFDTGESIPIQRFHAILASKNTYAKKSVYIIAEAGSNWRTGTGALDLTVAKQLIDAAAQAGANAVKFQVFQPESIYVSNAGQSDYLAEAGINENITALFENLAMPHEVIPQLAAWAHEAGIDFMATPFSEKDFAAVDPYVKMHKIASYEIGYSRLIELAAQSGKPVLMSTGAAKEEEIAWAVDYFRQHGGKALTLLQCTAKYPAPADSMNLRTIPWLMQRFNVAGGLSDHSLHPLIAPLGAAALGATVIEKHFTMDKNFEGPDHAFALTPEELTQMVVLIRQMEDMLGSGMKYVHTCEEELRHFARRGIQALKNIRKGDSLVEGENIGVLRPGKQKLGVHSLFLPQIVGKKALRDIPVGSGIQQGDFGD